MTGAMIKALHLLLAILFTNSNLNMYSAHAWQPSGAGALQTRSLQTAHEADGMHAVDAFDVPGAIVHGPVGDRLQAELLQQVEDPDAAGRSLLHGSKKPNKWPKCRTCRMIRCNRSRQFCSGHCRRSRAVHFCSTNTKAASFNDCVRGKERTLEEVEGLPPDIMFTYDTAVVTAPAPYIGCANIANRPSGCPASGTPVILPGRVRGVVASARCRAEYYAPECDSPVLPFGICECIYRPHRTPRQPRPRPIIAPCTTNRLPLGYGVGGSDGSPSEEGLVVVRAGDFTQTWFSNFTEPGEEPEFMYSVAATSRSVDVDVTMSFFPEVLVEVEEEYIEEGVEISEDYDYGVLQ